MLQMMLQMLQGLVAGQAKRHPAARPQFTIALQSGSPESGARQVPWR